MEYVVLTNDSKSVTHKTAAMAGLTCDEASTYVNNLNAREPGRYYCQILTSTDYEKRFPVKTGKPEFHRGYKRGADLLCMASFERLSL